MTTILVTGASGHLGRRVVELLLENAQGEIVAATRNPEKLADFAQRGVSVRYADFDKPETLVEAFAGVDRLLLISTDMLAVPGQRLQQHRNAVHAAEKAGVQHVVYTSLINPDAESPIPFAGDHRGTEAALAESKLGWTVLRENFYAEVLLGSLPASVQMGQLFSAAGDGKTAYITREDCARAAAAALTSNFEGRRTLDITGPEALSQADLARIVSEISGQPVTYVPITLEVAIQNLVAVGLPQPIAEVYVSIDMAIAEDRYGSVSSSVEDLTGRKPMSIAEFLAVYREVLVPQEM